jgi:hypothetical protein
LLCAKANPYSTVINDIDPIPGHIQAFRASLKAIEDDADKLEACVAMRDELLEQRTELEWLFACAEGVMVDECPQYREKRRVWLRKAYVDADTQAGAELKQWERFINIAESGIKMKEECLAPLTKTSGYWGIEKVRHYKWVSMGLKYCKVLGTAASRNPDWEEASVKLNQLLLSRIAEGRSLRVSVNPINLVDLEHLKTWSEKNDYERKGRKTCTLKYHPITRSALPAGYAFDQYGLIVLKEVADQLRPAAHPDAEIAEVCTASAAIVASPLSVVIDTSASSPSLASPETQNSAHSSSTSPLSSLRNTPAHSPTSNTFASSCVLDECPSTALSRTPQASAGTIARLEPVAVGATSRTSNRLRSCPKLSYASPSLRRGSFRPSTRCQSARLNKTAGSSKSGCEPTTSCSCSDKVAPNFLSVVEREPKTNTTEDLEIVMKYEAQQELLCLKHLKMYAKWATACMLCHQMPEDIVSIRTPKRPTFDLFDPLPFAAAKRRRLSLPGAGSEFHRRSEGAVQNPGFIFLPVAEESKGPRPVHDVQGDASFRQQVMAQLERNLMPKKSPKTWGELNNQVMYSLLSRASQPRTLGDESEEEVYFMTGEEARSLLESGATLHGPIITEGQQQFQWEQRKGRPVEQLFRRMGNPNRTVSVQKPSLSLQQPSCVVMRLGDVYDAFAEDKASDDPLNVLDLRNPLPRSILPHFLTGEDCQLLSRVRDTILEGATAERCTAQVTEWNKWRDDEDWVLLAQGGAHTLTHQDSCGKATWLTVQEGLFGFGWISHPSREEIASWSADPNGFRGGQLRYVVLRPGQTVYFEAGTIHFVFRLKQYQTLFAGGHVLRWSRIESWMEIVLTQLRFPDTTNEDLLPSVRAYVEAVAQLVSEKLSLGRSDELGGEEAVARFFDLKTVSRCGARW